MLFGLVLLPVALAYGIAGGDGRIELALLAFGAVIFYGAWSIERKRSP
jgi:hypothetical protein